MTMLKRFIKVMVLAGCAVVSLLYIAYVLHQILLVRKWQ